MCSICNQIRENQVLGIEEASPTGPVGPPTSPPEASITLVKEEPTGPVVLSTFVHCATIFRIAGLDPITVFWQDFAPGKGQLTIACSGEAWATCFNTMRDKNIQQFILAADADYLLQKLCRGIESRQATIRLKRIVRAAQKALGGNNE